MRIGLLTAYHLGEEITIQGHSSNGKDFTLTGSLLDVEHSFEDDEFEDDDDYAGPGRFTEVSLRLSESGEITIELPADHEVTVESAELGDEDDDED